MSSKDNRGLGADVFFQNVDEPIKRKGGRKKVFKAGERKKISFWVRQSQLGELVAVMNDERAKLIKSGKNYSQVTQTSLIDQALEEFLARRRRRK